MAATLCPPHARRGCLCSGTAWRPVPVPAVSPDRRNLDVGVVGLPEGELRGEPVAESGVELCVVAGSVGVGGDRPADVDVVGDELCGERGAAAHRVEVAAPEVGACGVADDVGERGGFAELELVPDKVDVVVVFADWPGRPRAAAGLPDEGEAGVDAANVVGEVAAADRRRDEIVVGKPGGCGGA